MPYLITVRICIASKVVPAAKASEECWSRNTVLYTSRATRERPCARSGRSSSAAAAFRRAISSSGGSSGAKDPSSAPAAGLSPSAGRRYDGGGRRATARMLSNFASQSDICVQLGHISRLELSLQHSHSGLPPHAACATFWREVPTTLSNPSRSIWLPITILRAYRLSRRAPQELGSRVHACKGRGACTVSVLKGKHASHRGDDALEGRLALLHRVKPGREAGRQHQLGALLHAEVPQLVRALQRALLLLQLRPRLLSLVCYCQRMPYSGAGLRSRCRCFP